MNLSEQLLMEWQYWQHIALFPHIITLHMDTVHEAVDDLRCLTTGSYS